MLGPEGLAAASGLTNNPVFLYFFFRLVQPLIHSGHIVPIPLFG